MLRKNYLTWRKVRTLHFETEVVVAGNARRE